MTTPPPLLQQAVMIPRVSHSEIDCDYRRLKTLQVPVCNILIELAGQRAYNIIACQSQL